MSRVVFHPNYDMGLLGLERLHPFDARKYGRAWRLLRGRLPPGTHVRPAAPVGRAELLAVHSADYLDRLGRSAYVAEALELAPLRYLPRFLLERCLLRPMRWATAGTILAAREAIATGLTLNLGGGFHHAKPGGGEGFCVYNDIALAVHRARAEQALGPEELVAYVDLDAHQGNGVSYAFQDDRRVWMLDLYNREAYPAHDAVALARVDRPQPLAPGCDEGDYLRILEGALPSFLADASAAGRIGLAIYNAGSDVYEGDSLGGLRVSAAGIARRDAYVVRELRARGIPTLILLSGGYSRESYRIVAESFAPLFGGG